MHSTLSSPRHERHRPHCNLLFDYLLSTIWVGVDMLYDNAEIPREASHVCQTRLTLFDLIFHILIIIIILLSLSTLKFACACKSSSSSPFYITLFVLHTGWKFVPQSVYSIPTTPLCLMRLVEHRNSPQSFGDCRLSIFWQCTPRSVLPSSGRAKLQIPA